MSTSIISPTPETIKFKLEQLREVRRFQAGLDEMSSFAQEAARLIEANDLTGLIDLLSPNTDGYGKISLGVTNPLNCLCLIAEELANEDQASS